MNESVALLKKVNFENIYLLGTVVDFDFKAETENLTIIMDGGVGASDTIVYFEIEFDLTLSMNYLNHEYWPKVLAKKYDLSILHENHWERGVYCIEKLCHEERELLDPSNRFGLVKYIVLARDRFFEIIATQKIVIRPYSSLN